MHTRTARRTSAARQSIRGWSQAWTVRPTYCPTERASVDDVEVKESTFGEWLAAGGDRRTNPRPMAERNGLVFSIRGA